MRRERRSGLFRLAVDGSCCDGHGICALLCAERVALDRFGYASVAREPFGPGRVLRRARRAEAACPAGALSVVTLGPAEPPSAGPRGVTGEGTADPAQLAP